MTQSTNALDAFKLNGRHALVTGGSKGLGIIMAGALADAGASVTVVSRTESECKQAADEIAQRTGQETYAAAGDVSQARDVERIIDQSQQALGPIDILINNAGINARGPAHELAESDWDDVIAINLKGPFLVARALGHEMCWRGWGRVINIGSILSVIGMQGRSPYAASKGGLLNLTRVMALEWAEHGVTANAICPGPFATEMNKPLLDDPEKYQAFVAKIPMGRWGELHEIAGAVLFLASDASSYVTGSALYVDGGWTTQ
ncbi:MAG: 2-deoxy-D-gluconate 3-dehydrogenase [Planctomycetaceae bacterium]|nr:2-deoxy-D-gluconate 3-dehydrogenase [Planctomycetaceae bacterium]